MGSERLKNSLQQSTLNMGILSPGNSFVEMILFWVLMLEKMPIGIEPFACNAIQMTNIFCILDVVLEIALVVRSISTAPLHVVRPMYKL